MISLVRFTKVKINGYAWKAQQDPILRLRNLAFLKEEENNFDFKTHQASRVDLNFYNAGVYTLDCRIGSWLQILGSASGR
jgi:hypothetical protein